MSQREYCHISREEFEEAIGMNGELRSGYAFLPKKLRGCLELVYDAIESDQFTIRVFSSIVPGTGSRDVGEDAIRFQRIFIKPDGAEKIVGTEKRVNRIKTWRKNLLARIEQISNEEVICCPICVSPMVQRRGSFGLFFGCTNYPACKGTRKIEK